MINKDRKNLGEIKILPITEEDLMAVFDLSNEESVRANSFNQNKIELEGHKNWFAKKLTDSNCIMLKASVDEQFAGQARIDIEEGIALVGVSVSENFRGKGIGSVLIKAAIEAAEEKGAEKIEAYIKPQNAASIKLFEKSGFHFDKKTEVSGNTALKYLYNPKE